MVQSFLDRHIKDMMFLEELMKQKEIIQRKLGLEGIEGKAA